MDLRKTIESTYNNISKEFSQTRNSPWGEFEEFKKYLSKGIKVLDVGCGNGRLYESIKDLNVDYTGVDISKKLLDEARRKYPDIRFIKNDMTELEPIKNERFDAIFFIASFHHLSDEKQRLKTLEKVKNLLKEDGKIFMTNWNIFQKKYRKYVWKSFLKLFISKYKWNDTFIPFTKGGKTTMRYYHAFTPQELEGLFKKSDLKIIEKFSFGKDSRTEKWKDSRNLCYVLGTTN